MMCYLYYKRSHAYRDQQIQARQKNILGGFGYNRDKKRGKKQIVVSLLWDESGDPVSVAVFSGDPPDISTFAHQISKIEDQFGCQQVTVVYDRGMIKSAQIDQMPQEIHYITAINKPQIDKIMGRWGTPDRAV